MKRLRFAIYTLFDDTPSLKALITDLFYEEAPKGAKFPYVTYTLVTDEKDASFSERIQDMLVRFNYFSKPENGKSTEVENIEDAFDVVFDEAELIVTDRDVALFHRTTRNQLKVNGVWQMSVLYHCVMEYDVPVHEIGVSNVKLWDLIGLKE